MLCLKSISRMKFLPSSAVECGSHCLMSDEPCDGIELITLDDTNSTDRENRNCSLGYIDGDVIDIGIDFGVRVLTSKPMGNQEEYTVFHNSCATNSKISFSVLFPIFF